LTDNAAAIVEACKRDLGKSVFETYLTEIDWCKNDVLYVCKNLAKWAKDERAQDMTLPNRFLNPKIRKDPLGCVLIIGYAHSSWSTLKHPNTDTSG
jgi:beta-apo-4'-carotenal oxygenase